MKRLGYLLVLVALGAATVALPAVANGTEQFGAQFHDSTSNCPPGTDICGKGAVEGFGTVTTSLTFTGFGPGPTANCVAATADRVAALDRDGSMLRLTLTGTICDQKIAGTFTIVGGTGVFDGASGEGTIWGVTIPGPPSDSVHFRGTITLP